MPAGRSGETSLKRAIISDIHANQEALQAVLADIAREGVTSIYCLGDIIGYGPNPCECIDAAMDFDASVLGNHDQGALFDPEGFSSGAERAIFWTREQLESPDHDPERHRARWDFLCELPRCRCEGPYMFVHGSPRSPLNEYVFPEDVHNPLKIRKIFAVVQQYCFQGHTHVPGVFTEEGRFLRPDQIGNIYTLGQEKCLVNVGSVGQPRDGDPRSCYVLIEDDHVQFRRVEYPFETTAAKIYAIADLDNFLGDRLRDGR
jgi:diadenosine tetraphosphatase ApaH/serine/threonine PP2A family protein phosphatase